MTASTTAPTPPAGGEGLRLTPQALAQEHDNWLHFIALTGENGRLWTEELRRPEHSEVVRTSVRALGLLHRRLFAEGLADIEQARERLEAVRGAPESIVLALESVYFPLRAYYDYCVEDYGEAVANLDRADRSVAAAIALERFLLPLAYRCSEFALHRARVARNQRLWAEMHHHIEVAWAMMEGDSPLCVLPDGSGINVSELVDFYRALPSLGAGVEEYLKGLTDSDLRRRLFGQFVNRIYALPGFVILYP